MQGHSGRDDGLGTEVAPADRGGQAAQDGGREAPDWRRPLLDRPVIRTGLYAWALVGLVAISAAVLYGVSRLSLVVVPFLLALFPAAVLSGPTTRLKKRMPDALATFVVLLGFLALLGGLIALLAPSVARELDGVVESAQDGARRVQDFLEQGPLGFQPIQVDQLLQQAQDRLADTEGLTATVLGALGSLVEGVTGLLLGVVVLFFYLKDGPRMARWLRDLFPERVRADAEAIGERTWQTVGGFIRGQLLVALVDAFFIGIGILVLGVPLAVPLIVLVFAGGLFPIVGAVISGLLAVLVALATTGVTQALILLAVILVVQQVEGDVLAPIVFGRTVQLHPLAILAALTAGGVLLGVLGAFIAIPLAASASRAVGYLRERVPD